MIINEDFFDDNKIEQIPDEPDYGNTSEHVPNFIYECCFNSEASTDAVNMEIRKKIHYILNSPVFSEQNIEEISVFLGTCSRYDRFNESDLINNIHGLDVKFDIMDNIGYISNIVVTIKFSANLSFKTPKELWNFFHIFTINVPASPKMLTRTLKIYPLVELKFSDKMYFVSPDDPGRYVKFQDGYYIPLYCRDNVYNWQNLRSFYYMFLNRNILNRFVDYINKNNKDPYCMFYYYVRAVECGKLEDTGNN